MGFGRSSFNNLLEVEIKAVVKHSYFRCWVVSLFHLIVVDLCDLCDLVVTSVFFLSLHFTLRILTNFPSVADGSVLICGALPRSRSHGFIQ